jgi:hypothetical protein
VKTSDLTDLVSVSKTLSCTETETAREDGDRMLSPKRFVSNKGRTMNCIQNCNSYRVIKLKISHLRYWFPGSLEPVSLASLDEACRWLVVT